MKTIGNTETKMFDGTPAELETLVVKFGNTCESFQSDICELARNNNKLTMQVYKWWREYSTDCQNYDQSAILWEFKQWYKDKLEQ